MPSRVQQVNKSKTKEQAPKRVKYWWQVCVPPDKVIMRRAPQLRFPIPVTGASTRKVEHSVTVPPVTTSNQIAMASPSAGRRPSKILLALDMPGSMQAYLDAVFPPAGLRPPMIEYTTNLQNGFPKLYGVDFLDPIELEPDQHWLIFQTRGELPPKYRSHVVRWLAYVIGTIVHHVAVRK